MVDKFNFEPRVVKTKCRCGVVFVRRSASHKYCCEKCRDEAYQREAEMKKAARREQKEKRAKTLIEQAKQSVVKALEVKPVQTEEVKPTYYAKKRVYSNNTPTKPKPRSGGMRLCGNCRQPFLSEDIRRNQRCSKCRAMAESASGMREFKLGR